jgi:hypothetical protein
VNIGWTHHSQKFFAALQKRESLAITVTAKRNEKGPDVLSRPKLGDRGTGTPLQHPALSEIVTPIRQWTVNQGAKAE